MSFKREKEMMMATYCKLIKENERLHDKLHLSVSNEKQGLNSSQIDMIELKMSMLREEIESLRSQIEKYDTLIQETETNNRITETELIEKNQKINQLEEHIRSYEERIKYLENELKQNISRIKELVSQTITDRKNIENDDDFYRKIINEKNEYALKIRDFQNQLKDFDKLKLREIELLNYINVSLTFI